MNVHPTDFTITVASGSGDANTKTVLGNAAGTIHGALMMVGIKPPNALSVFDLAIYDSAGYLLYAENDMTGESATVSMEKLCNSPLRLVLSNCSYDGSYSVRLYAKN
jgi:hypothetical protein